MMALISHKNQILLRFKEELKRIMAENNRLVMEKVEELERRRKNAQNN